jgi:hypothetical protein
MGSPICVRPNDTSALMSPTITIEGKEAFLELPDPRIAGRSKYDRVKMWGRSTRGPVTMHALDSFDDPLTGEVMMSEESNEQQVLAFVDADKKTGKNITGDEYAVQVTHTDDEIFILGQFYRYRADAENAFDELKNPWGWGSSFTTCDRRRRFFSA